MKQTLVAAGLLSLLLTSSAFAQNTVGEVSFANSGSPAAQPAFLRGLALLHNFEYPTAAESFREAQKIDPDFAMAYWGEAMTYTHPVWFQQNATAARAVLERLGATPAARAAKAKTDRERAYLKTVEILYGDGTKDERDFKFADAMADLHRQYPNDVDATAFYALSLLGTSHNGRDTATYMRAAALLEEVFPEHQHHPGVLHYLIHSYDDPIHAPLGMRAARRYGAVAPEAGHALHMTSHIFIAMGMWDDVIDANRRAIAVVNKQRAARGKSAQNCGHYPTWLHYALLQEHQTAEARKMLDTCRADALNPDFKSAGGFDTADGRMNEYAQMVASQVMSGGALDDAERLTPPENFTEARFTLAYAEAIDAYRRNDAAALRAASSQLRALQQAAESKPMDHADMGMNMSANDVQRMAIVLQQIDALQLAAAGKRDDAIALLRKAAAAEQAMPFEFGPPAIQKPTYELLAEQLAAANRSAEATEAYRTALARTPGRTVVVEALRKQPAAMDHAMPPASVSQDWAKQRVDRSPRHHEWVNIKSGNRVVSAFVVYPEVKSKAPAVVVIHEIFGMSDWVQMLADEVAEAGYIAIAPDLLSGMGPFTDANAIGKAIRDLPPDQITADLNATADYVAKLPASNGRVAVAGFCWGGTQAFRFSTNRSSLAAAFVFYGTGPESPDAIAAIKAPVHGFYAGNDARVGATVPKTQEMMKAAGKTFDVETYEGAGHGFMRAGDAPPSPDDAAYAGNKKARDAAWVRWKALLAKM